MAVLHFRGISLFSIDLVKIEGLFHPKKWRIFNEFLPTDTSARIKPAWLEQGVFSERDLLPGSLLNAV